MSKSNKKQTTRGKPAKQRPKPKHPKHSDTSAFVRSICAITNPFCNAARGSKWPDQSSAPTLPVTVEGTIQIVTDAAGNAAVLLLPLYPAGYSFAVAIDPVTNIAEFGDTIPYAAGDSFIGAARAYRMVSGGATLTPTASPMTSQGMMRGIEISGSGSSGSNDYDTVDIGSMAYTQVSLKPVRESGSLYGYFKPSGNEAREFNSFSSTSQTTDVTTNDWTALVFAIQGGPPSTTIGQIHYIFHLELSFVQGSAYNRFATKPPTPNTLVTNASAYVGSRTSSFFSGVLANVEHAFMNKAITYATSAIANRFMPGSGPAVAMLTSAAMEVD